MLSKAPRGVSACFGIGRTFSPLCFTDSGFKSDSTQCPADCTVPKQVSYFDLKDFRRINALVRLLVIYGCDMYCSYSFLSVPFPLGGMGMLYVLFYVPMW
jgi:hypothetical protein